MAGSSYNYDKNSSFFATEDDMDAAFLSGRRAYQTSTPNEKYEQLMEEKRKIEERTVQSSIRSLSLLHDSEHLGNETAKELTHQREQLVNTEVKLDEINKTLRTSQRHIQGIKSVFGSIRNYFSGTKPDGVKMSASTSDSELDKKDGSSGKSQLGQILESKQEESSSSRDSRQHPTERFRSDSTPTSQQVDSILDRNLEDMGEIVGRLKGLGMELNREIDDQNQLIERIHRKTEDVDFKVQVQTKEMNRILKK